jgi:hypothetical protein
MPNTIFRPKFLKSLVHEVDAFLRIALDPGIIFDPS